MRTFDDAHREAITAGCPLAQITRRIDKSCNGAPVIPGMRITIPEGGNVHDVVQSVGVVSVPAGAWRAALLGLGWSDAGGDIEVQVDRASVYDPRKVEPPPSVT